TIARWMPIVHYDTRRLLDFTSGLLAGHAVAYVDERELNNATAEVAALDALGLERTPGIAGLVDRLKPGGVEGGIVYLACHGTFATPGDHPHMVDQLTKGRIGLGDASNAESGISVLDFEALPQVAEPRPLVFVNACHSGRMFNDTGLRFGLPE